MNSFTKKKAWKKLGTQMQKHEKICVDMTVAKQPGWSLEYFTSWTAAEKQQQAEAASDVSGAIWTLQLQLR